MRTHLTCTFALSALVSPLSAQCFDQGPDLGQQPAFQYNAIGFTVSLDGDLALVGSGSGFDLNAAEFQGTVLTYREIGDQWTPLQELRPAVPDAVGSFGFAVHIEGDEALVGAPSRSDVGDFAGAVFVYEFDGSQFVQQQILYPNPPTNFEQFGQRIARSGNLAAIGNVSGSSLYVFERSAGSWSQVAVLSAGDGALDFVGDCLLVGEPGEGRVRVYEDVSGTWQATGTIDPAQAGYSRFGSDLQAHGNRVAILAEKGPGTPQGEAVIFERAVGGAWSQVTELSIQGQPLSGSEVPASVAFDGQRVVIGYPTGVPFDGFIAGYGTAYSFRESGGQWQQEPGRLDPEHQPSLPDAFGRELAVQGQTVLVGAPGAYDGTGQGYFLDLLDGITAYGFCDAGSPCGNPNPWGGCRNAFGDGAVLSACGSTSIQLDNLQIQGARLRPQNTAFLFVGSGPSAGTPFFDGLLAVSGPFARFQPQQSSIWGTVQVGPGLVASSQSFPAGLQLGMGTAYFQMAYRDPGGPCGSAINLTNALAVTMVP